MNVFGISTSKEEEVHYWYDNADEHTLLVLLWLVGVPPLVTPPPPVCRCLCLLSAPPPPIHVWCHSSPKFAFFHPSLSKLIVACLHWRCHHRLMIVGSGGGVPRETQKPAPDIVSLPLSLSWLLLRPPPPGRCSRWHRLTRKKFSLSLMKIPPPPCHHCSPPCHRPPLFSQTPTRLRSSLLFLWLIVVFSVTPRLLLILATKPSSHHGDINPVNTIFVDQLSWTLSNANHMSGS